MLNTMAVECVKVVKNMGIINGKSSVHIPTERQESSDQRTFNCVKMVFVRLCLLDYPTGLYTRPSTKINLLNKSFTYYPHHLLTNPLNEI